MCPLCSPQSLNTDWHGQGGIDSIPRYSVYDYCVRAVQIHKWIESEKAGRDLGEEAVRAWIRKHWYATIRGLWLEHLNGIKFWIELDQDDYGLLQTEFGDHPLVAEIVNQLRGNGENFSIIVWGHDTNQDMDLLIKILEVLNVNSRRIECDLAIILGLC
jgi:hypothetical protein